MRINIDVNYYTVINYRVSVAMAIVGCHASVMYNVWSQHKIYILKPTYTNLPLKVAAVEVCVVQMVKAALRHHTLWCE